MMLRCLPLLGLVGLSLGCAEQADMSTCWDSGYFDYYDVPKCKAECDRTPGCNTWAVTTGGVKRCHLCTKPSYFTPAPTWRAGCVTSTSACGIKADMSTCWDVGYIDYATRESCSGACTKSGACKTWALMKGGVWRCHLCSQETYFTFRAGSEAGCVVSSASTPVPTAVPPKPTPVPTAVPPKPTPAPTQTPSTGPVIDSSCHRLNTVTNCWNLGYGDGVMSAGACQLACQMMDNCVEWELSGSRCHLCSNAATFRAGNGQTAGTRFCGASMTAATRASQLASVLRTRVETFCASGRLAGNELAETKTLLQGLALGVQLGGNTAAVNVVTRALQQAMQGRECRVVKCGAESSLRDMIASLVLTVSPNDAAAYSAVLSGKRLALYQKHRMNIVDNGYLNDASLDTIDKFYSELPSGLMLKGVRMDATFTTLTVRDAYACNGFALESFGPFSPRGFNIFDMQVGDYTEQGFPGDGGITLNEDVTMTVVRHETSHQFDRILPSLGLSAWFTELKRLSAGSDLNWLRSQVGDSFFQGAPQEVIASQMGNLYLADSYKTLSLALLRHRGGRAAPLGWFLLMCDLASDKTNSVPMFRNTGRGTTTRGDVTATRDGTGKIKSLALSCGMLTFTYGANGLVSSYSGPNSC